MALDKDRLGDAIANAIIAAEPGFSAEEETDLKDKWKIIAKEIVDEIINNAVVSTNVAVASVSAVTPGAGVSGPGAGTGAGTIS